MKYKIFAKDTLIGQAIFYGNDSDMGVYIGRFKPLQAYYEVRSIFLLYTKSAHIQE